ncbi:helix-turn-helix domain-containing protein [Liquorilactobacillus uvarum]|uniref:Transcriptional regulator n=1 Tax=Liquorilactobacillus uvarum DSM 19971 TaxID=1423812 RepID=A0A0R1PYS8_9LACO|nr:Rgg/GadR/MutR family transcriptional regulator [Liquorilactobacillus uvarum]KRL37617.1 transcriptional regulator [Liquorilactobacillus uvarum DSM 19971]
MIKIGQTFKEFRTSKNITLQEASQGIVSVPFLSRFERGLTDISFTHLLELLNRINVQLSELEFLYQTRNTAGNDLLPNFQRAYQSGDSAQLREYLHAWQSRSGRFAKLQIIQIKMMLTTLGAASITDNELLVLEDYFKNISNWTFFELYLFGHSIPFLDKAFMFTLFEELQKKEIIYENFRHDNFSLLFYIYNNIILFLLDSSDSLEIAESLVTKLETYFKNQDKDYYHRTRIFNLKGLTLYLRGKKKEGLILLKKANLIAHLTEHEPQFLLNEKNYLAKYLTAKEIDYIFDFSDIHI